jgi:hypothetical protein
MKVKAKPLTTSCYKWFIVRKQSFVVAACILAVALAAELPPYPQNGPAYPAPAPEVQISFNSITFKSNLTVSLLLALKSENFQKNSGFYFY